MLIVALCEAIRSSSVFRTPAAMLAPTSPSGTHSSPIRVCRAGPEAQKFEDVAVRRAHLAPARAAVAHSPCLTSRSVGANLVCPPLFRFLPHQLALVMLARVRRPSRALLLHGCRSTQHLSRSGHPVRPFASASASPHTPHPAPRPQTRIHRYGRRAAITLLSLAALYGLDTEFNASAITRNLRTLWAVSLPSAPPHLVV